MRWTMAAASAALLASTPVAAAYCSEPRFSDHAPSAPFGPPSRPGCLGSFGGSECEQADLNSYEGEVEDYIRELEDFAQEARRFADAASEFADDVRDYGECRADEAREPLR